MTAARWVAAGRLVCSAVLLVAPRRVLSGALAPQERNSPRARGVVRVLGMRTLVQSVVELVRPTRLVLTVAAAADLTHALSFLGFAAARPDPRWRRAVLINVVTAVAFAVATVSTRPGRRAPQAGPAGSIATGQSDTARR